MQNILETLVLNDYETIFAIDIRTQHYSKSLSKPGAVLNVPEIGTFSEAMRMLADRTVTEDRERFLREVEVGRIVEKIVESGQHIVRYRILNHHHSLRYRRLSFIFTEDRQGLIGAVYDETQEILEKRNVERDLRLKNEGIRFIVRHMCENFIVVDPETDGMTIYVNDLETMHPQKTYREQLRWFAENIVVPEERENYLRYFELDSLMQEIRNHGGICRTPCTVELPDGRHDYIITCTLIRDPVDPDRHSYLFSSAQDITELKKAVEANQKLLQSSLYDGLTKLLNRAAAERKIREHLHGSQWTMPNTFLLMDIDYFKTFNDRYGHITGDAVLKHMGDAMRKTFRTTDILCRWGGDEFVVFLPGFGDMETIRTRLSALQEKMKAFRNGEAPLPITLSIGGVVAPGNVTLNTLFSQADEALYTVKNSGRDGIALVKYQAETEEVS